LLAVNLFLFPACVCLTFSLPNSECIAVRIGEHGRHAFCERFSVAFRVAVSFGRSVAFSLTFWLRHTAFLRHGQSGETMEDAVGSLD
jgi:hypothetical protein